MQDDFDIIIVGAGPGGSNAASVALSRGCRVAQIDQRAFPRIKPCAGALTVKACNALQLELAPTLRQVATAFEFNVWHDRTNRFWHRSPIMKMVYRPEFDNSLVEQNRRSERLAFFDGEPVRTIEYDGQFTVRTSRRTLRGTQLIGADGAYSFVNRRFAIAAPKAFAVAVEVNLPHDTAPKGMDLVPRFDFGAIERGYGWIFPKDDHSSVGLYTLAKGLPHMRQRLLDYIRARGFVVGPDTLESFEAFQIPVGGYALTVPDLPVYLVGDAGGFGDAITGEGIYHALESGRLAGETASDVASGRAVTHRRYYRRLWRTVLPDTFLTYKFSKLWYRNISKASRALEHPLVWRPFAQGYADGATFTRSLVMGGYYFARSFLAGSRLDGRRHAAG